MGGIAAGIAAGADDQLRVLGFAGSLRAGSYNGALLRSARELAPAGLAIEIYESIELPLFNEDIEAQGDPEPVAAFKAAIGEADAILIATPEYNYGVPGVLKNAIDWASRRRAGGPSTARWRRSSARVWARSDRRARSSSSGRCSPSLTHSQCCSPRCWWAEHTRSSTAMDTSRTRRRAHSCGSTWRPSMGGRRACCAGP